MRENALLQHIYAANASLPEGITLPPGDDMGAVRVGSEELLVTTDQLADGVHVNLAETPLAWVARKAIRRSLSDIAAMGAKPVAAVATACLPREFTQGQAAELADELRQDAQAWACPLIGGDVSVWDHPLLLTVTAFATPPKGGAITRSGAKPGDFVYVTGRLGGSLQRVGDTQSHHLSFTPRIKLADKLAHCPKHRPNAMMDLSDGLAMDLPRLCEQSGVGAVIEIDQLPVSPAAELAATHSGRPAWQHAIGDGEDYELLFTVPLEEMPTRILDVPITVVGRITSGPGVALKMPDGTQQPVDPIDLGWEHQGTNGGAS